MPIRSSTSGTNSSTELITLDGYTSGSPIALDVSLYDLYGQLYAPAAFASGIQVRGLTWGERTDLGQLAAPEHVRSFVLYSLPMMPLSYQASLTQVSVNDPSTLGQQSIQVCCMD